MTHKQLANIWIEKDTEFEDIILMMEPLMKSGFKIISNGEEGHSYRVIKLKRKVLE